VICLKDTAPVEGVEIVSCMYERDVLNTWIDVLRNESVDVLIGYNILMYDWKYIYGRSKMCVDELTGLDTVKLSRLGRKVSGGGEVIERELTSNAFGQNYFFYLDTPGVLQLDLLQWFRKNRSHESYALNAMSKFYLNDQKNDLPAFKIFENFEGTPEDRAVIAAYAAQDTRLPLRLLKKLSIFEDVTEMANAVKVPVEYINFRGQQVIVVVFLLCLCLDYL
jgi:DNA polymerase delta subunit 1